MLRNHGCVSILKNPWRRSVRQITIEITENTMTLVFNAVEAKAPAYVTNIKTDLKKIPLCSLGVNRLLELNANESYEIVFSDKHSGIKKRIFKLPNEINKNLLHFLTGGRRPKDNCMDFVNAMLFGCGKIEAHTITLNSVLSEIILDDKNLEIGQALAFGHGRETKLLKHFAIYLGDGLCISVTGDDNPLYVTTLEQMKLIYSVNAVVKVTPVPGPYHVARLTQ